MDAVEKARLIELINNPPPGSKIAAAKEYGLDLTLLLSRLILTPTERLEELQSAQEFIEQFRESMSTAR
jgi:hypothetical protein